MVLSDTFHSRLIFILEMHSPNGDCLLPQAIKSETVKDKTSTQFLVMQEI